MNLKKLLEMEDEFEAWEVEATNRDLAKLMRMGILTITFKSNRNTYWKVKDREKLESLIKLRETEIRLKGPLFSSVIGHEAHKDLILKAIERGQHLLLYGDVATAKTLFLLELTKVQGSCYLTPYITYSGLYDILSLSPKILLIDQIDNLKDNSVYKLLIELMEYGIIAKLTHSSLSKSKIKAVVIATANSLKRIPEALLSRFLIVRFLRYDEKEYEEVVKKLLEDEGKSEELVNYIIEKTIRKRDVRNALKLAKLCDSKEEVDKFMDIIRFA